MRKRGSGRPSRREAGNGAALRLMGRHPGQGPRNRGTSRCPGQRRGKDPRRASFAAGYPCRTLRIRLQRGCAHLPLLKQCQQLLANRIVTDPAQEAGRASQARTPQATLAGAPPGRSVVFALFSVSASGLLMRCIRASPKQSTRGWSWDSTIGGRMVLGSVVVVALDIGRTCNGRVTI